MTVPFLGSPSFSLLRLSARRIFPASSQLGAADGSAGGSSDRRVSDGHDSLPSAGELMPDSEGPDGSVPRKSSPEGGDLPAPSIEERLARLEGWVAELREEQSAAGMPMASPPPSPGRAEPQPDDACVWGAELPSARRPKPPRRTAEFWAASGERWLGRIGVGFVILALAFLFNLAFERGWITPEFRLMLGLLLGAILLGAGLRLYTSRQILSRILLGGAIGIFYVVGFAGFQLYELIPYFPSFAFLVAVTVLALALSIRQEQASLAVIGSIGGFATPFLLYTEEGSVPGLVGYVALVMVGGAMIYLKRGWSSLLSVLAVGSIAVMDTAATGAVAACWRAVPGSRDVAACAAGVLLPLGAALAIDGPWAFLVGARPSWCSTSAPSDGLSPTWERSLTWVPP